MARLNTDDYNVVEMTVSEARKLIDDIDIDVGKPNFITILDIAQGDVHSDSVTERYLIIRIS
jgi:hypothetical protein